MVTTCVMCEGNAKGYGASAKIAGVLLRPLCSDCKKKCHTTPDRVLAYYPHLFDRNQTVSTNHLVNEPSSNTAATQALTNIPVGEIISGGIIASIIGALVGYALRPPSPVIGQLDFNTVIQRGSNLRGVDQFLISYAQTSFSYMIFGAIIGSMLGAYLTYLFYKKGGANIEAYMSRIKNTAVESTQTRNRNDITENIKKLSELKDQRILTEEEFQAKKTELLNRL